LKRIYGISASDGADRFSHASTAKELFGAFVLCFIARGIQIIQTRILGHATAIVPRMWRTMRFDKEWTKALEYYLDLMRKRVI
jgi:hypothetical protein